MSGSQPGPGNSNAVSPRKKFPDQKDIEVWEKIEKDEENGYQKRIEENIHLEFDSV